MNSFRTAWKELKEEVLLNREIPPELVKKIDFLHEDDNYGEDDRPLQKESLEAFLDWIDTNKPGIQPSLGMSYKGYLVASWLRLWGNDEIRDSVILEFMQNKQVKYFLTTHNSIENGITHVGDSYLIEITKLFITESEFDKAIRGTD